MSRKRIFNIGVILFSIIAIAVIIQQTSGWSDLGKQLKNLQWPWIAAGAVCMILYWMMEGKTLHSIAKVVHGKSSFFRILKNTLVGQFFNSITPFAAGGQPAQMYDMTRNGIKAGTAASILMTRFIVYQSVLFLYSLVLIIWKATFFLHSMSNLFYLIFIGFGINALVLGGLILFSSHRGLTEKIFKLITALLKKLRIKKDLSKWEEKMNTQLTMFHDNAAVVIRNPLLLLKTVSYTILQLTSFFIIPYFIYRAFGLSQTMFIDILAAEAFVRLITAFVPLPGASGGAEGGFYLFYGLFFPKPFILPAILLWRLVTYYSCIAVGGLFLIRKKKEKLA